MRIGSSIGLIAVGLILAPAVDFDTSGVDLSLIGWILAVVGVLGLAQPIGSSPASGCSAIQRSASA